MSSLSIKLNLESLLVISFTKRNKEREEGGGGGGGGSAMSFIGMVYR